MYRTAARKGTFGRNETPARAINEKGVRPRQMCQAIERDRYGFEKFSNLSTPQIGTLR